MTASSSAFLRAGVIAPPHKWVKSIALISGGIAELKEAELTLLLDWLLMDSLLDSLVLDSELLISLALDSLALDSLLLDSLLLDSLLLGKELAELALLTAEDWLEELIGMPRLDAELLLERLLALLMALLLIEDALPGLLASAALFELELCTTGGTELALLTGEDFSSSAPLPPQAPRLNTNIRRANRATVPGMKSSRVWQV